ncbi:UDP-glucose 4-epimerase GalE [Ferribacterium limneticum]|uniref:UDP-glucose 4-epimerase GalE n=1 Tax=Ferribacterium limneticum TaxID=76259 RepID=UPI001CFA1298|nr:UDP-glucose 4-epimerase GalE [Ferribacterium limneticum]UCV17259.1 UDP-glucose 4-epimerase GalE [Ferribacterium limneticum]
MMILVTGGAGYIGSHTVVQLIAAGHDLVILDNFSNSSPKVLDRIFAISGSRPQVIDGDIRDPVLLKRIFSEYPIDAVIHFAGLKAVGESVAQPIRYFDNNVVGSLRLFEAMAEANVKTLVFSSSATVYGDPHAVPICESFPLQATNPYGRTKLHIEEMLRDISCADPTWRIALLRYFNPVGAHPSGLIGEDPQGIPNNLMPYVTQVAVGRRAELGVFGNDYPTPDGTGVRDYIHVVDLARGHLAALDALVKAEELITVNLGTGRGYSVLDVVAAFERASGKPVPYQILPRRAGDVASCFADPAVAFEKLGWRAEFDLDDMCRDSWRWQEGNPEGY